MSQQYDVFIGDSYSSAQGVDANERWAAVYCRINGTMELNYAVAGQGYARGEFEAQLNRAAEYAASQGIVHMIRHVFIVGSRNDGNDANRSRKDVYRDTYSWVGRALDCASDFFPESQIVVVPLLWSNAMEEHLAPSNRVAAAEATFDAARLRPGIFVVDDAWLWLVGRNDIMQSDGAHPNKTGQLIIASNMINVVNGFHSTGGIRYWGRKIDHHDLSGQLQVAWSNGLVYISGILTILSGMQVGDIVVDEGIPVLARILVGHENGGGLGLGPVPIGFAVIREVGGRPDVRSRGDDSFLIMTLGEEGDLVLTPRMQCGSGADSDEKDAGTWSSGTTIVIMPVVIPIPFATLDWSIRKER